MAFGFLLMRSPGGLWAGYIYIGLGVLSIAPRPPCANNLEMPECVQRHMAKVSGLMLLIPVLLVLFSVGVNVFVLGKSARSELKDLLGALLLLFAFLLSTFGEKYAKPMFLALRMSRRVLLMLLCVAVVALALLIALGVVFYLSVHSGVKNESVSDLSTASTIAFFIFQLVGQSLFKKSIMPDISKIQEALEKAKRSDGVFQDIAEVQVQPLLRSSSSQAQPLSAGKPRPSNQRMPPHWGPVMPQSRLSSLRPKSKSARGIPGSMAGPAELELQSKLPDQCRMPPDGLPATQEDVELQPVLHEGQDVELQPHEGQDVELQPVAPCKFAQKRVPQHQFMEKQVDIYRKFV